jgi:hypothetical protein
LINKSHPGLGNLYAFSLLATKAGKVTMIVSPAGTGKSVTMRAVRDVNKDGAITLSSITRSGLKGMQQELCGFKGTVMIEDLGNIDTNYSLQESVKTAVALAYDHQLTKVNSMVDIQIVDFYGSVITSVQPEMMQQIINTPAWEAVMRDKTLRYYHLIRATKPNREALNGHALWGLPTRKVKYKTPRGKSFKELLDVFLDQHGITRAHEHIEDMCKAAAALDSRTEVSTKDVRVVLELTRPMRLEKFLFYKEGIASEKHFLTDDCYMLCEFATYGKKIHKWQLASNWKVTQRQTNRILLNVKWLFTVDPRDLGIVYRSKECGMILEEAGYR